MNKPIMKLCMSLLLFGSVVSSAPAFAAGDDQTKADVQQLKKDVDELLGRLDVVETQTLTDRLDWHAELRSRFDNFHYKLDGGSVDQKMNFVPSTRLRLGMNADVSDNLKFTGRVVMFKRWGDRDFPYRTDGSRIMYEDTASTREPSDASLRVERAYVDYFFDVWKLPMAFSFGRFPGTDSMPTDLRDNTPRKSNYPQIAYDQEGDCIGLSVGLDRLMPFMPGSAFKVIYTQWLSDNELYPYWRSEYTSLSTNQTVEIPTNTPSYVFQFETGLPGKLEDTMFILNYVYTPTARIRDDQVFGADVLAGTFADAVGAAVAQGVADSLPSALGATVTPGAVTYDSIDLPSSVATVNKMTGYIQSRNLLGNWLDIFGGYSRMTVSVNGNILINYTVPITISGTPGGLYDASFNQPYSLPFGVFNNGDESRKNSSAFHVGTRLNLPIGMLNNPKLGLEYNHASRYWFPLSYGSEDPLHKLDEKGSVYDVYWFQPITKYLTSRFGYTKVNRDWAPGSYGEAVEEKAKITNWYMFVDMKF